MPQTRTQVLHQRLLALKDTLRRRARKSQSLSRLPPYSTQERPPTPDEVAATLHRTQNELAARRNNEAYAAQWYTSWAVDADPCRPAISPSTTPPPRESAPRESPPRAPEPQQPNERERVPLRRSGAIRRRARGSWRTDYSLRQLYRSQSPSMQNSSLHNLLTPPSSDQDPPEDPEDDEASDQLSPLSESPVSYRHRAGSSPFLTWRASRDSRKGRRSRWLLRGQPLAVPPRHALRLPFRLPPYSAPTMRSYRGKLFVRPERRGWMRVGERRAREAGFL